jgi:hypothetical protein
MRGHGAILRGQREVRTAAAAARGRVRQRARHRRDTFLRAHFARLERLGIHAVPRHWFEPIPDRDQLSDDVFVRRSAMVGVDLRLDDQERLLGRLAQRYRSEYSQYPRQADGTGGFYLENGWFEAVDAEVLHAIVRWLKPRQVIEVGTGFSSLVINAALRANASDGHSGSHLAIDPEPGRAFDQLDDCELLSARVQDVPLTVFENLQANDILFIDSSHCVTTGGDVTFEMLEVFPRLKPGVVIHVHDVFLPGEYPKQWLWNLSFPTEQYLLQAFMAFNHDFEVLLAANALAAARPEILEAAVASFDRVSVSPGSFWLRRTGSALPEV